MKIKHAKMEVLDRHGNYVRSGDEVHLKGAIDLTIRHGDRFKHAEIRRHVNDADLAEDRGQETGDTLVLMDWFEIQNPDVTFHGDRLTLTGYMSGVKGHRRHGESPYGESGHGNAYMDDDQPLVHVRWDLW